MMGIGRIAIAAAAAMLPLAAAAQDATAHFWLKANPNNIQGCIAVDPQFTREHTFTLQNGQAKVTSAGGVNSGMTMVRPDVYQTTFVLGQWNLLVVADLASTPKTLTVTDRNLGCRWSAMKQ